MDKFISQSAFAKQIGVSRQAISKLVVSGVIPTVGTSKKINLENEHVKSYIEKHLSKNKNQNSEGDVSETKRENNNQENSNDQDQSIGDGDQDSNKKSLKDVDRAYLDKTRVYWQQKKIELEVLETRGTLVSCEDVKKVFNKIIAVDKSQWQQLGSSVSADICSELGHNDPESEMKVRTIIEDRVFKIQKTIQLILKDWVDKQ